MTEQPHPSPAINKRQAFTIIELLIVIVVIGILAAITIVSFNGIQKRAQAAATQTAVSQTAKKILTYSITNNDLYPATLADADVPNSDTTTYKYWVDNFVSPRTYCLSATSGSASYYQNSTTSTTTIGGCPVTNHAVNPSANTNALNLIGFGFAGTPAPRTTSIATDQYHSGPSSYKVVANGSGQLGAMAQTPNNTLHLSIGDTLSWSFWVYATKTVTPYLYAEGSRTTSGTYWGSGVVSTPSVPANTWTRVTGSWTSSVDGYTGQAGAYNIAVTSGDALWFDDFMVTKTSDFPLYSDGNNTAAGWIWNGVANASTSTGQAL